MKKIILVLLALSTWSSVNAQGVMLGNEFLLHDNVSYIMSNSSSLENVSEKSYTFSLYLEDDSPVLCIKDSENNIILTRVFEKSILVFTGGGVFVVMGADEKSKAAVFYKDGVWVCSIY